MPAMRSKEDLTRQISLLRRRVRLLAVAVVVLASLLLTGAAFQRPDRLPGLRTIEANEFVLRDVNGQTRARLEVTETGPALVFFDEAGKRVARVPAIAGVKPAAPR